MSEDYLKDILKSNPSAPLHGFFSRPDLLEELAVKGLNPKYILEREKRLNFLIRDTWLEIYEKFLNLPKASQSEYEIVDGYITVKSGDESSKTLILELVASLIPWRKGPWEINDVRIDAEWRSNLKYDRLASVLPQIQGKNIVDIGGGNGYYSFRALKDGARNVVVFDPSEKFFFQFELFQKYLQLPNIQFEIGGYSEAVLTGLTFDVGFCFGIFYHQKNPLDLIEACHKLISPKGLLVLETMYVDGDDSTLFFPPDRYAKARNVYFLPTISSLESILGRSGFKNFHVNDVSVTDFDEQRTTKYMPYESLNFFLDPVDKSKTIEGFQAPKRVLITAERK